MGAQRPVRVLLVSYQSPAEYAGWISQTRSMIAACDPRLFAFAWLAGPGRDSGEAVGRCGPLQVTALPVHLRPGSSASRLEFSLRASGYVLQHKHTFDVLYLPMAYLPTPLLLVLGRLLRMPVVVRIARGEVSRTTKPAAVLRQRTLRLASAVVALNGAAAVRMRELSIDPARIRCISNGVDTDRFRPASRDERAKIRAGLGVDEDDFVVAFVGSICRRKGVDALVEAFGKFSACGARGRLLLVGPVEGAEAEPGFVSEIRQYIASNGLGRSVLLLGQADHVEEALRASDVFVLPSVAEGMPNALLEAMATGLACIGTDIPGVRAIVDSGENGLLVPPRDADALARAMERLFGCRELRLAMGLAGLETVRRSFSIAQSAAAYEQLFGRLAGRQSP